MKKCIVLSLFILLFIGQLRGITAGDDKGPGQNPGQPAATAPSGQGTTSEDPLYAQAVSDFRAGMYPEALEKFRLVLQKEIGESPGKEKALRYTADCYYFLGLKGNKSNLLAASDLYKNIMQKYPGSRNENALAAFRVADSYATLNFYYEAKREFENFYKTYPESPYISEAVFRMGELLYNTQKYDEAAVKYEEYIGKFPGGQHIKSAYFNLGDCYSQNHQDELAEKRYREALDKWPELENIPEKVLLKLGIHYFKSMKYQNALRVFFFYINVFPDRENNKEVLFLTARSLMELNSLPLSLKMFSLVIEKFPGSREATESAIIMANIGVKKPGMKLPFYFHGMQNYRDPLQTYNDMLAKNPTGEYAEELLFQKGYVLHRNGRYKDSFDTYSLLLGQFPRGRYKAEALKSFLATAERLVEENYARGDYLELADIYFKSREQGVIAGDHFKMAYSMGDSLKRLGLYNEAMEVFEKLLKTCGSAADRNRVSLAIADIDCERGNYENVEKILQQLSTAPLEPEQAPPLRNRKSKHKLTAKSPAPDSRMQKQINRILGNVNFKKLQFDRAALHYARVLASDEGIEDIAVIYRNYAQCQRALKSVPAAIASYQKAIEVYNRDSRKYHAEVIVDLYRGLGDCLFEEGRYAEAISMYKQSLAKLGGQTEGLWSIYGMGRGYAKLREAGMVDRTFSELKNKGGEGFWSNLADHALREYSWHEKYASMRQ